MNHSEMLNHILHKFNIIKTKKKELTLGAEIGVRHGITTRYLLDGNPNLQLTLVDPFAPYQDVEHNYTQAEQDEICNAFEGSLKTYHNYTFYRKTSLEAAAEHAEKNLSFDFVFIDACHTYVNCKSDIEAWWPLVKVGGILCGHDYSMDGVKLAVRDTFQEKCKGILAWTMPETDIWVMFKE